MTLLPTLTPQLSDAALALLAIASVTALALALRVQFVTWLIGRQIALVRSDLVDESTGLLAQGALPARLGTELVWARAAEVPIGVAVLHIRGPRFDGAAHVLLDAMREEEHAYLLGMQHVVVGLWDANLEACLLAVRRLGIALHDADHVYVDAGLAMQGADGDDVDELIEAARGRLMPIDQQPAASPETVLAPARPRVWNGLRIMAMTAPWWVAWLVLLAALQRLIPYVFGLRAGDDGISTATGVAIFIAVAIAAALLHVSGWNLVSRTLPRSRPVRRASWRGAALVAGAIAIFGAWAVLLPDLIDGLPQLAGASLIVIIVLALTLTQARYLVHADGVSLTIVAAVGALAVWYGVEAADSAYPVLANVGRLVFAAALGAILARMLERLSWLVVLAVLAVAIDIWSLGADSGISRGLLDGSNAHAGRALDLLLYTAPLAQGHPLFELGTSDLVLASMFVAAAHRWRLNVHVTTIGIAAGIAVAYGLGAATDHAVPVLPFIAAVVVVQVAAVSLLRRR